MPKIYCLGCGKEISWQTKMCLECENKYQMDDEKPIRLNVSDKKLHNHIRNIIINELGVDKDFIEGVVEQRVDIFLERLFTNTYGALYQAIMKHVEKRLASGFKDNAYSRSFDYYNGDIDKVLRNAIKDYVVDWLESKVVLDISFKGNDSENNTRD